MTDLKKFERHLPPLFLRLNEELSRRGYTVTAVGGIVRDFLMEGEVGTDWDLELTHPSLGWDIKTWKDLGKELGRSGRVSFLPYDVIRLEGQGLIFELSPPRREIFTAETHHKNFTVIFDYRMPFEEAVKRRDFTVNAIGIRFNHQAKAELMDPLNGVLHLRDRELRPCGVDFGRDPVRYIRAIRFSTRLGFSIVGPLRAIMDGMDIGSVSPAYFWGELQKSKRPLQFYKKLLEEKATHPELRLPTGDILGKITALEKVLVDPTRHESWIIALEWEDIPSIGWQKFFGLSTETGRRLERWARTTKDFTRIMPEEFHGDFEKVRETPPFELLFDWYFTTRQILQKNPELPLLRMIDSYLPQWGHLYKFEAPKDVKHIDPPLRAKYQVWNLCQRL